MLTLKDICEALASGECDSQLDLLREAINARKETLARNRAAALCIGDRVRLTNIRPRYFEGELATVVGFEGAKIRVETDRRVSARYSQSLIIHNTHFVKI